MKSTRKMTNGAKDPAMVSREAKSITPAVPMPANQEIAIRAYQLSAHSGHQPGRDVEFWLEAEQQLQRALNKK